MAECRRFYISGRVQGVFFRATTRDRSVSETLAMALELAKRRIPANEGRGSGGVLPEQHVDLLSVFLEFVAVAAAVVQVLVQPGDAGEEGLRLALAFEAIVRLDQRAQQGVEVGSTVTLFHRAVASEVLRMVQDHYVAKVSVIGRKAP